uniref:Uncharacterized protein n=1 Tax=Anguilla anguilla TaxID=7936 RepID=A0A0E9T471_ANGAN
MFVSYAYFYDSIESFLKCDQNNILILCFVC